MESLSRIKKGAFFPGMKSVQPKLRSLGTNAEKRAIAIAAHQRGEEIYFESLAGYLLTRSP
jgi:hypothetical protein